MDSKHTSRRHAALVVAIAAALLAALYVWIRVTRPEVDGLDATVNGLVAPGSSEVLAAFSAGTDTGPLIAASAIVAVGIAWSYSIRLAGGFLAASLLSSQVVTLLKATIERPRPTAGIEQYASFAWPSGHTAGSLTFAAGVAAVAYLAGDRLTARFSAFVLIPSALVVGYSRVFLGVHWPTDVLAGWLLAVAVVAALVWLVPAREASRSLIPVRAFLAFGLVTLIVAGA